MSLSQRILAIWNTSSYKAPNIPLIYADDQYMVLIDDSGTFLRFMSAFGDIYVALNINNNCQYAVADPSIGDNVYICTKITPILCSATGGPKNDRDTFVLNNIISLLK